jgi:HSP20 family protein
MDVDRLFEHFFDRDWMRPFSWSGFPWDEAPGGLPEVRLPGVDVIDRDDQVLVRAEMPGVDKKDVSVSISDNVLTIKGAVARDEKEEKGDYYRREITHGSYFRQLSLPPSVEGARLGAKLRDGVLEITIPKRKGSARHTIKVE